MKSDDPASQQSSYIFLGTFFDYYETPGNVIFNIYVQLIRLHKPEVFLIAFVLSMSEPASYSFRF